MYAKILMMGKFSQDVKIVLFFFSFLQKKIVKILQIEKLIRFLTHVKANEF